MTIRQWQMTAVGKPLVRRAREVPRLGPGEALVRVAGCGVCHTDIGFLFDGVRTRRPLPLTLGHEVSGWVEDTGTGARDLVGAEVVIPAVWPCGECTACRKGRGQICPDQSFLGNDVDGGFASHVVVPARSLVPVHRPRSVAAEAIALSDLAVVADAVSTPYQAVKRSGLGPGEMAIFVGAGGVGAFGVQIAAARGATVAAIDIDRDRLALTRSHGAAMTFDASVGDVKAMKKTLREQARQRGLPLTEWKIFETSGTRAGQETAFQLLVPGAYLSVVGYTTDSATVPLSHLMAFDARVEGNWGCLPELYPEVLALVLGGRIELAPFLEMRPLEQLNDVLTATHERRLRKRAVVVPDLDG